MTCFTSFTQVKIAMTLTNNISATYSHTNQTGTFRLTESDRLKLVEFVEQLFLCQKIVLIFLAIFTILGNTLVLIVTWREKSLHQPNKYFIACLAVADLLVGIFLAPLKLYNLDLIKAKLSTPVHLCRFMVWIDTFTVTTSIYTLTLISFDRYLKIRKPLHYKFKMTTSRSLKIIFVIALLAISYATYSATPRSGSLGILSSGYGDCALDFKSNKVKVFYLFLSISVFFLPAIFILIMHAYIFLVAHKRNKMLANGDLGQTINDQNQRTALRRDMKVVRMLLLVVGVFIFCWGPWFSVTLLLFYDPNFPDWDGNSLSYWYAILATLCVTDLLPLFNSLCNPIIYACLDRTYREAFKHLFYKIMCRQDSRRQQTLIELAHREPDQKAYAKQTCSSIELNH